MGTSKSSSGSPSGVPMVPPWVPAVATPIDATPAKPGPEGQAPPHAPAESGEASPEVAPPGRFRPARGSIGRFARGGDGRDMRRALGHYVRTGLGGTRTGSRRLAGTAHTAGALYSALSQLAAGQSPTGTPLDRDLLAGKSARGVIAAVVEAIRPVDGTLDTEASRNAVSLALSDLLTKFPEADLLNLSEIERAFAIESFVARDVYNRFHLDLGQSILRMAPSATVAAARSKEVLDYMRQTVSAAFRNLASRGETLAASRIAQLVQTVVRDALIVFEEYVQ